MPGQSAVDPQRPEGRRTGKPALSPAASAPATFVALVGSGGMHAELPWFPRLYPPCQAAINPREQKHYRISRRNAQGEITKRAFYKGFAGSVPARLVPARVAVAIFFYVKMRSNQLLLGVRDAIPT